MTESLFVNRCVAIGRLTEDVIDSLLIPKGTRLYVVSHLSLEDEWGRKTPASYTVESKRTILRCVSDLAVDSREIVRGWIVHVERSKVEFTGESVMTDTLEPFLVDAIEQVVDESTDGE